MNDCTYERKTGERICEPTGGSLDGDVNRRTIGGRANVRTDGQVYRWISRHMEEWTDGQIDELLMGE